MDWRELHKKCLVLDLHTHPCLKTTIFPRRSIGVGKSQFITRFFKETFWPFSERVTFPKMAEGDVDVIMSTAYTLEQGWIDDISLIKWLLWCTPWVRKRIVDPTYFDATIAMLDEMEQQISDYNSTRPGDARHATLVTDREELQNGISAGDMCVIHAVEGAHCLQGREAGRTFSDAIMAGQQEIEDEILANLQNFSDRGVAYLTLAHFYPNYVAPPVFPYPEYGAKHLNWREVLGRWDETEGLTPTGVKVVEKMLELGMLIDISHCTIAARKQVYDIVDSADKQECVMATHVGAFEINRLTYNLQDWELKWLADHGGVVGIIFMNYWISAVDSGLGLKHIEHTLKHIINTCGTETAAIGTDFDGFTDPPDEIVDMSELPRMTSYLKGLDYSDEIVEKFLGKNALRLLLNGWKP